MKKLTVKLTATEAVFGWVYLGLQLFVIPTVIVVANLIMGSPLDETGLNIIYFVFNFLCVALIFRKYLIACGKIALANKGHTLVSAVFGYLIHWGLSIVVTVVILLIYPEFNNVNDANIQSMVDDNFILTAIGTILLVPITEEVLYRGLIFQGLHGKSRFWAYAVSAIAFCMPHVLGYIGAYSPLHLLLCFIQYLPAGLALAWAYERADSIWAPILLHTFVNLAGVGAMIAR